MIERKECAPEAPSQAAQGNGAAAQRRPTRGISRPLVWFIGLAACLSLLFGRVLLDWVRFALDSELYSHVVLIPFVSAYLVWLKRDSLAPDPHPPRALAALPLVSGLAILGMMWTAQRSGWKPTETDFLAWSMLAFVALLVAGAWFIFGRRVLAKVCFPAAFLAFAAPFPEVVLDWIVTALQYGSAEVAYLMLYASGVPILRTGTIFELPGISMEVAPQCSGIHSTLVLFIVSLVAGYLFLQRPWARAVLAVVVAPLALLRNGFRIFTIGQLCVQVDPEMINSYIHRQGGPIFFALSLIPFFLLLLLLRRLEHRRAATHPDNTHENLAS